MRRVTPWRVFILSVLTTYGVQLLTRRWTATSRAASGEHVLRTPPLYRFTEGLGTGAPGDAQIVNGSLAQAVVSNSGGKAVKTFAAALTSVSKRAERHVGSRVDDTLAKRMRGVPGTSISSDEEASRLQAYLDCVIAHGSWHRDERGSSLLASVGGVTVHKQSSSFAACDKRFYKDHPPGSAPGWDVRGDLKYRWQAEPSCDRHLPSRLLELWSSDASHFSDLPTRHSLCQLLRHKNILLVGDATTHYLVHDLILDWTSDKPLTCYGDLFCNEHGICGGSLAESSSDTHGWNHDETINEKLPLPDGTYEPALRLKTRHDDHPPQAIEGKTYGTIIRYRRSDGLYLRSSPSMAGHSPQYFHPATDVREINNYALADARRSDLILINKAPLPVPAVRSRYGKQIRALESAPTAERAASALRLALTLTEEVWLPDLIDSLVALRAPPSPEEQLVVYRSSWRGALDCRSAVDQTVTHLLPPPSLKDLLDNSNSSEEVSSLVHDLQVILQNHAARTVVLPTFGIPFLDVETPLSVWQTGWVFGGPPKNCIQPCLPSPGMALERAVIGGLWKIMAWGWTKDEASTSRWVGDAYIPIRVRSHAKAPRH